MIHLTTLGWTQLILIETGFLFLICALSAHLRSTAIYRASMETEGENENPSQDAEESPKPQKAKENLATWTPAVRRAPENTAMTLNAGNLLETAKIGFVQTFGHRQQSQS